MSEEQRTPERLSLRERVLRLWHGHRAVLLRRARKFVGGGQERLAEDLLGGRHRYDRPTLPTDTRSGNHSFPSRRILRRGLSAALVLVAVAASESWAQQVVVVSEGTPCIDCIQLRSGGLMDGGDDRLFIARHPRYALDSQGGLAVADLMGVELYRFDSEGRLVATIGGSGDGPGEFRVIADLLFTPEDSLYVFEFTGKVSVFDRDGNFGRWFQIPGGQPRAVAPASSGAFLRVGQIRRPDAIGYPIHRFSADGERDCGFGTDSPGLDPRSDPPQEVLEPDIVAQGPSGRIYLVVRYRYEIEIWEPCGAHIATVERAASWFPGLDSLDGYHDYVNLENGNPVVSSIHVDESRRLWVTVVVAPPPESDTVEYLPGAFGRDQRWDTILEVIDLGSGELLATARAPVVMAFSPGGALVKREIDELGMQSLRTWFPQWDR